MSKLGTNDVIIHLNQMNDICNKTKQMDMYQLYEKITIGFNINIRLYEMLEL